MHWQTRELLRAQAHDVDEYTLSARGEVLGHVDVRPGVRPGPEFGGYFHPVRAFTRYVRFFDEHERVAEWETLLGMRDFTPRISTSGARRRRTFVQAHARARAKAALTVAESVLRRLGLELLDPGGGSLGPCAICIERVRIEGDARLMEPGETPPIFAQIDAGVDVSPYWLRACPIEEESPARARGARSARGGRWHSPPQRSKGAQTLAAALADAEQWTADLERELWSDDEPADDPDAELEWEGSCPSFEDRVELWRRAAAGHRRDTFRSILDLARSDTFCEDEQQEQWIRSVQRARAEGVLEEELSHYLICRITDEWLFSGTLSEVLLSVGETALEAAIRERPEEFAARMAAWEARLEGEKTPPRVTRSA